MCSISKLLNPVATEPVGVYPPAHRDHEECICEASLLPTLNICADAEDTFMCRAGTAQGLHLMKTPSLGAMGVAELVEPPFHNVSQLAIEPSEVDFHNLFNAREQLETKLDYSYWARESTGSLTSASSNDPTYDDSSSEYSDDSYIYEYGSSDLQSRLEQGQSCLINGNDAQKQPSSLESNAIHVALSAACEDHQPDCLCVDCFIWRAYASEKAVFGECSCIGCRTDALTTEIMRSDDCFKERNHAEEDCVSSSNSSK